MLACLLAREWMDGTPCCSCSPPPCLAPAPAPAPTPPQPLPDRPSTRAALPGSELKLVNEGKGTEQSYNFSLWLPEEIQVGGGRLRPACLVCPRPPLPCTPCSVPPICSNFPLPAAHLACPVHPTNGRMPSSFGPSVSLRHPLPPNAPAPHLCLLYRRSPPSPPTLSSRSSTTPSKLRCASLCGAALHCVCCSVLGTRTHAHTPPGGRLAGAAAACTGINGSPSHPLISAPCLPPHAPPPPRIKVYVRKFSGFATEGKRPRMWLLLR